MTPVEVGPLRLRNRFVKTATYEGMSPGGRVSDALVEHHAAIARRGVALTTVAYLAVVAAVRDAVGDDVCLLGKTNLEDGVPGGSTAEDAVEIARALEAAGVHGLVSSSRCTHCNRCVAEMDLGGVRCVL